MQSEKSIQEERPEAEKGDAAPCYAEEANAAECDRVLREWLIGTNDEVCDADAIIEEVSVLLVRMQKIEKFCAERQGYCARSAHDCENSLKLLLQEENDSSSSTRSSNWLNILTTSYTHNVSSPKSKAYKKEGFMQDLEDGMKEQAERFSIRQQKYSELRQDLRRCVIETETKMHNGSQQVSRLKANAKRAQVQVNRCRAEICRNQQFIHQMHIEAEAADSQVNVLSSRALREFHACGGEDTADPVRQASEVANRAVLHAKKMHERLAFTQKKYNQQLDDLKQAADDGIGTLSALERAQRDVGTTLSSFRKNTLLPKLHTALFTINTLEGIASKVGIDPNDPFLSSSTLLAQAPTASHQKYEMRCVSAALSLFREAQTRVQASASTARGNGSSSSESETFDSMLTQLFTTTRHNEVDAQVDAILAEVSGQESQVIAALNRIRGIGKACLSTHYGLKGLAKICQALFRSFRAAPNKETTPAVLIMLAQTFYVDGTTSADDDKDSDDASSETRRRARRIYLKQELKGSELLDDRLWTHSMRLAALDAVAATTSHRPPYYDIIFTKEQDELAAEIHRAVHAQVAALCFSMRDLGANTLDVAAFASMQANQYQLPRNDRKHILFAFTTALDGDSDDNTKTTTHNLPPQPYTS